MEKFFVSEDKKFGRIDSWFDLAQVNVKLKNSFALDVVFCFAIQAVSILNRNFSNQMTMHSLKNKTGFRPVS